MSRKSLPRPYIDFSTGKVRFACTHLLLCRYKQIKRDALVCTYYGEQGCTHRKAAIQTLMLHVQTYQTTLQELGAVTGTAKQMRLHDLRGQDFFGPGETRPCLPTPYIDSQSGQVSFACWHPRYCQRRHRGDSLVCTYHISRAHWCTNNVVCAQTLMLHVQTYQTTLQALEVAK